MGSSLGILSLNSGASYSDRSNAEYPLAALPWLNARTTKLVFIIIISFWTAVFF